MLYYSIDFFHDISLQDVGDHGYPRFPFLLYVNYDGFLGEILECFPVALFTIFNSVFFLDVYHSRFNLLFYLGKVNKHILQKIY